MRKKLFAALVAVLVAIPLLFTLPLHEATAQNVGFSGRWPSDSGTPKYGYAVVTDTTDTTMIAAQGANTSIYVYEAQCVSTSATAAAAILEAADTSIAVVPCVPSSGYSQPIVYDPPLEVGNNKLLSMETSTSITSGYFYVSARSARSQTR